MKIKVINADYEEIISKPRGKHKRPKKPNMFFRALMRVVAAPDLRKTKFKVKRVGMERLPKGEPAFYLMNHSAFIDMEIVARVLYPRPFNIVTTTDAFVGKDLLLRQIGCIPTKKFVHDPSLIRDIIHAVKKLKSNVVLFPEAGYSFDGTSTTLPDTLGKMVKMLGAPLVMIRTYGAFLRDPLYNNLQLRDVKVSATEEFLLSSEEIANMSEADIHKIILEKFTFDNFAWQKENGVVIDEPTRADYLNRVLYKCPRCGCEGKMLGKGTDITCSECGLSHTLTELGELVGNGGDTYFSSIPEWYAWERECVRKEILAGTYSLDLPVDILMAIDTKKVYRVGEGRLTHGISGFKLTGCDGKLNYEHKPLSSYSICADFNWYEIGDVISFGNHDALYYCFPRTEGDVVAKARLAAEEIYKILMAEKHKSNE
ncbi:MAG: 1-acyl-sn-glycerol-3-phosphate acyltransferase [Clostridia bacterium]|nr:1-acyl-sn-glycerol-3-phosphate acyltransferase [Clostridia bacterium]